MLNMMQWWGWWAMVEIAPPGSALPPALGAGRRGLRVVPSGTGYVQPYVEMVAASLNGSGDLGCSCAVKLSAQIPEDRPRRIPLSALRQQAIHAQIPHIHGHIQTCTRLIEMQAARSSRDSGIQFTDALESCR